ncbi:MAG TPA: hypothetical protein VMK65_09595 [Longimicrobiales bacterium]|nr:hypothetical protein [Longimicrobiales bacterium]
MPNPSSTRRAFLRGLPAGLLGLTLLPRRAFAGSGRRPTDHPEPRPGIDASRVLRGDQVPPHAARVFDRVREIPHIVDGIRCHCGCADLPDIYSLLSCYEETGMARHCEICQGEANLAWTLHGQGKSLAEIRIAVDERYG